MKIKFIRGVIMSVLSIASEVVNTVWNVGSEAVNVVSNEVKESIKDEALRRTKKYFKKNAQKDIAVTDPKFIKRYKKEYKKVADEYKSLALKGGLIVFGLSFLA
jgi:CRISPR/Cas system CSM-associated protein Csm5 (group 7 of RAMP superfamily)